MKLNELSKDKLEQLKALKTEEEMLAFIEKEDIELDINLLENVSGGASTYTCSDCGEVFAKGSAYLIHVMNHPDAENFTKAIKDITTLC